jgi:NitT/TauT family transport system substrate-binding protein
VGPAYTDVSGAFGRVGIVADLQAYPSVFAISQQTFEKLGAGAIDVGFTDIISAVNAIQTGVPVIIVAAGGIWDSAAPTTELIAPIGRPVHTGADLIGKTIALPGRNNLGEVGVRYWIDKHGGDSQSVRYVSMGFDEMVGALNRGDADAAETTEPFKTQIRNDVQFVAPAFDDIAPRFVIGVFVALKSWVRDNPSLAKRFASAMAEGGAWANTHHAETASLLAQRFHTDPAILAASVRATFPDRLTPSLIQPVVDVASIYGICHHVDAATLLAF